MAKPDDNKKLYDAVLAKGDQGKGKNGRLTAFADSGIGLIKETS